MNNKLQVSVLLSSTSKFKDVLSSIKSICIQTYSNIQIVIGTEFIDETQTHRLEKYINKHKTCNIKEVIIDKNDKSCAVNQQDMLYKKCTGDLIMNMVAGDVLAKISTIEDLVCEYESNNREVRFFISPPIANNESNTNMSKEFFSLVNEWDKKKLFEEFSYSSEVILHETLVERSVYEDIGDLSEYSGAKKWAIILRLVQKGIRFKYAKEPVFINNPIDTAYKFNINEKERYSYILNVYEKEVLPYEQEMSPYAAKRARQYSNLMKEKLDTYLTNNEKTKIVFYSRKGAGAKGDFSLYNRIGSILAKDPRYAVYCVNNEIPELKEKYLDSNIIFCEITEENLKNFEGATFVFPISTLFCLLEEIEKLKEAKLISLYLHPSIFDWLLFQVRIKSFDSDELIRLLKNNDAYAFQDGENLFRLEGYTKEKLEPRFFPAMIDDPISEKKVISTKNIDKEIVNVSWLGRLDADKVSSIINFLDNLYECVGEKLVKFHIIGDGAAKNKIDIQKYASKIKIVFCSYLFGEARDKYIVENSDFVVAMGVSSLDAASLGVPVVLPIVSPSPFREDIFLYLYETKDYCIGWSLDGFKKSNLKGRTCDSIIQDIYNDGRKAEIAQKCYDYATENFAVSKNAPKVLNLINSTSLTLSSLRKNKSVVKQMRYFKIYRMFINKKSDWYRYTLFVNKVKSLKKYSKRDALKIVAKKGKKLLIAKKNKKA